MNSPTPITRRLQLIANFIHTKKDILEDCGIDMSTYYYILRQVVKYIDIPKGHSQFGEHYANCPWSKDSCKCGPDTCECHYFENNWKHFETNVLNKK